MSKQQSAGWATRIVGYGKMAASDFLANPLNFRVHPTDQQQQLEGVLEDIGIIAPVIVNRTTGNMVDGHLRVTLALRRGATTELDVAFVELSEAEEKLALASYDQITYGATKDAEKLDKLLREISTDSPALQEMFAAMAEEANMYLDAAMQAGNAANKGTGAGGDEFDPIPDEQGEPTAKLGDIWQLGNHKLLCGDSTDASQVKLLFVKDIADMVWTDPPYGVSYVGKTKDALTIENDSLDALQLGDFLERCFKIALEHCKMGGGLVCSGPAGAAT